MDKIKEFFQNKVVKIVAWCLLAVSIIVLIIGGTPVADLSKGVVLTAAIVSAVSALVAFITAMIKKKE